MNKEKKYTITDTTFNCNNNPSKCDIVNEDILSKNNTNLSNIHLSIKFKPKPISNPSIFDIANYFIWLGQDCGDPITNLKLQKLCYYTEAYYLAIYNKPLTGEVFQAWPHGPVSENLYHIYKDYKWKPITILRKRPYFKKQIEKHLEEIVNTFFHYSAFELELLTHRDDPWKEARRNCKKDEPSRNPIDSESMKKFYKKYLK